MRPGKGGSSHEDPFSCHGSCDRRCGCRRADVGRQRCKCSSGHHCDRNRAGCCEGIPHDKEGPRISCERRLIWCVLDHRCARHRHQERDAAVHRLDEQVPRDCRLPCGEEWQVLEVDRRPEGGEARNVERRCSEEHGWLVQGHEDHRCRNRGCARTRQVGQAERCGPRGSRQVGDREGCDDVDTAETRCHDVPRRKSEGRRPERHRDWPRPRL